MNKLIYLIVLVSIAGKRADIPDKKYASLPSIFHIDNYDKCMLYEDDAFFCRITYVLSPIDENNVNEIWLNIKNVTSDEYNYRHDQLRHYICATETCPNVVKNLNDDDPILRQQLEECYNAKYSHLGLKGSITQFHCEGQEPIFAIDWLDIAFALCLTLYAGFVLFATIYDSIISHKPKEEYEKIMQNTKNKILTTFSITRSWTKLKTVHSTPDVERLRCIQGIRVYNIGLVVICHTLLTYLVGPITNTKYPEKLHEGNAVMLFSTGPLCVGSNFFIAAFLLAQGLFEYLKDKKGMNVKTLSFALISRWFRLTPTLLVVILFHATWLRHAGRGPLWHNAIGKEFIKCRKHGWTNLFFLNNWIGSRAMCAAETWYLAVDTQLFILSLLFIWVLKKHEKHIWSIIGATLSIICLITFYQNYYYGYPAVVALTAEQNYDLEQTLSSDQFMIQTISIIGNTTCSITGIAFGYAYYKNKNRKMFNTNFRKFLFWIFSFGLAIGYLIVTGIIIFKWSTEPNLFWASVYNAVSRPIVTSCVGVAILGFSEGVGWLALRVVQWPPTYILGRLTFSVYLVHVPLAYYRFAMGRSALYFNEYLIGLTFLGEFVLSYVIGTLLTLFIEMPIAELQKYIFVRPQPAPVKESKDK